MSPEELQTRARRMVGEVLNQRDHAVANELEGEIAEWDPVVLRITGHGTHQGGLFGVLPTGRHSPGRVVRCPANRPANHPST